MRPEQTKEDRSGSSCQRGEALEGNLLAPPTHSVVLLMKGAEGQSCRSSHVLWAR